MSEAHDSGNGLFETLRSACERDDGRQVAAIQLAIVDHRLDTLTSWRQRLSRELTAVRRERRTLLRMLEGEPSAHDVVSRLSRLQVPRCNLGDITSQLSSQPSVSAGDGDGPTGVP